MSIEVMRTRRRTATACRAVICAFAATGLLAINIFLPSLPAIAAELRVSSADVTSNISVFLAIGRLVCRYNPAARQRRDIRALLVEIQIDAADQELDPDGGCAG